MAKRKKKRRKPKRPDFSKLERAEVLWEEGETEEAIEILEEFVQRWPHNLDGRLFLGSIYAELGIFTRQPTISNQQLAFPRGIPWFTSL